MADSRSFGESRSRIAAETTLCESSYLDELRHLDTDFRRYDGKKKAILNRY